MLCFATQGDRPTGGRIGIYRHSYALNSADGQALRQVWATDALAQLNNPVGGVLRGEDIALYDAIFAGARPRVTFGDVIEYAGDAHVVFAGRETGSYCDGDREVPLSIRTTRYFRYQYGNWRQYHHHGSIDAGLRREQCKRCLHCRAD
ncbi:MAG: nuclear transport factor 2 family protein [Sciscionella sp.]|nr:nuclear transport factor 2 family protein [Sciscionella sp.]